MGHPPQRAACGVTAARGAGGTAVLSGTHGHTSPSTPDLRFSFVPFHFPAWFSGLSYEFTFRKRCIWLQKGPNSILPPFHHHLSWFLD